MPQRCAVRTGKHRCPEGAIWFATDNGVYRYEPHTVEAFTAADGLGPNPVRGLLATGDGALWLDTSVEGRPSLARFQDGRFTVYEGAELPSGAAAWYTAIVNSKSQPNGATGLLATGPDGWLWTS